MPYFLWLPCMCVEHACFIVVWWIYIAHSCIVFLSDLWSYMFVHSMFGFRMTWQKLIRGLLMSVGKLMTSISIQRSVSFHLSQAKLWSAWNHLRQEI
jgi:hypothetical protein